MFIQQLRLPVYVHPTIEATCVCSSNNCDMNWSLSLWMVICLNLYNIIYVRNLFKESHNVFVSQYLQ